MERWGRFVEPAELVNVARHVLAKGTDITMNRVFGVWDEGEKMRGKFLAPV